MPVQIEFPHDAPLQPYQVAMAGRLLPIYLKPGLALDGRPSPAAHLLALALEQLYAFDPLSPGSHALLIGSGAGALAVYFSLSFPGSSLSVLDHNYLALTLTQKTLALNKIASVQVYCEPTLPSNAHDHFQVVMLEVGKGRKLARRMLIEAFHALVCGGSLLLAGANDLGIQSVVKDAEQLFRNSAVMGYKKGCRVVRLVKTREFPELPEWAYEPGVAPQTWYEFDQEIQGTTFSFRSLPGVFSYNSLDEGTALLIEQLVIPSGGRVLDLGCGYGPVGVFAASQGAGQVDMVDLDLLAVLSARENVSLNQAAAARAFACDGIPAGGIYDLIASNPPFHSGKEVDFQVTQGFIAAARKTLAPGGSLVLVANRFIRYEHVIERYFPRVRVLAENSKYKVLAARIERK